MDNQSFASDFFKQRFRGFLPVVIDLETGGFNPEKDAILEIAAVTLSVDKSGLLLPSETIFHAVNPFPGANIEASAIEFTGIAVHSPLRGAIDEAQAIKNIFQHIRSEIKQHECNRAILVAHNAAFDHQFLKAAIARNNIKRNPFHSFSSFDTVSLAGLAYGHTVLATACDLAGIEFNTKEAHSALYDATKTAELFCKIVNRWQALGGWPPRGQGR